jgi:hypothetical protein
MLSLYFSAFLLIIVFAATVCLLERIKRKLQGSDFSVTSFPHKVCLIQFSPFFSAGKRKDDDLLACKSVEGRQDKNRL